MNQFQQDEQRLRGEEAAYAAKLRRDPKGFPNPTPVPQGKATPKPMATARELGVPVAEGYAEVDCQTCGGLGFDPGSLDPFGELCPDCKGSKKELVMVSAQPAQTREVA